MTVMVGDIDIQTAMKNGYPDASCTSSQGNSGSPFGTFSAKPSSARKNPIVIDRETFVGWLKAGTRGAETAHQEHGTLTEITEEEEYVAVFLASFVRLDF